MKEKLISFTRNQKNVKAINIIHCIISIFYIIIMMTTLEEISFIMIILICLIYNTSFFTKEVVKILSNKNEEKIRNNKVALLIFNQPNILEDIVINIMLFVDIIMMKIMMIYLSKAGKAIISINLFEILAELGVAIGVALLIRSISSNTREYCERKIK